MPRSLDKETQTSVEPYTAEQIIALKLMQTMYNLQTKVYATPESYFLKKKIIALLFSRKMF
jgi:hypothetical protein